MKSTVTVIDGSKTKSWDFDEVFDGIDGVPTYRVLCAVRAAFPDKDILADAMEAGFPTIQDAERVVEAGNPWGATETVQLLRESWDRSFGA